MDGGQVSRRPGPALGCSAIVDVDTGIRMERLRKATKILSQWSVAGPRFEVETSRMVAARPRSSISISGK
jgi:hypothetical protein